jgi:hypothetical protein
MMTEQSLLNILNAANPDDAEDVAIRKFLVNTLRARIQFPAHGNECRSAGAAMPAPFPATVAARERGLSR